MPILYIISYLLVLSPVKYDIAIKLKQANYSLRKFLQIYGR
jgi:hypothetical protein